ncbi:glycyl-tRna synthetase [Cardiosporidium cionae]|uniref:glycine--tRNA ligase n=1 Tax=Cardiosporidium cionae TaxID=476202 RepID=A0ABQ7JF51_9APIC|nr:glycyl-tRna synthetase [Cardiosporidium cionae]|eukprot:KAF8822647.1 glycyl-tRna synthetase [Cardiosporidium cionae]
MAVHIFPALKIQNLLRRRFFVCPSFEIYGGSSGLYDLGPPGAALKAEIEQLWRQHFIIHDDMLEISATSLTPYKVLKASGHVDRFTDLMVRDHTTQEVFRADQYLEDVLQDKVKFFHSQQISLSPERRDLLLRSVPSLSCAELAVVYKELNLKSPNGYDLSDPYPFNLMFQTQFGSRKNNADPTSDVAFLRPETAQGIFVNFKRLLEQNGGKIPFATAQLGTSYRNEISPRNGLLRVREFPMAEIEHFVHPEFKQHAKFQSVEELCLPLYPRTIQATGGDVLTCINLREAVDKKMIDNETLAYFLGRTYLFLIRCGIKADAMRFRQHLETEMAHYASDCWDAELACSYGWVEVVGHADRSAFDLSRHSEESQTDLSACFKYEIPISKSCVRYVPNKPLLGKIFKKESILINQIIEGKLTAAKMEIEENLQKDGKTELKDCTGKTFEITRDMMKFVPFTKTVFEESFIPNVIEPSFGIGRLLHCVLEHTFRSRELSEQEERCYLAIPPVIAPIKCSILPISNNKSFITLCDKLRSLCLKRGLSCKIDATGASIGKRYARTDEIGIPFAVTVDFQSLQDDTVTIRERDTTKQIRAPFSEAPIIIYDIIHDFFNWEGIMTKYPVFVEQEIKHS